MSGWVIVSLDFGYALFKGIVQGLTEFLPVSSTAHLVFTDAVAKMLGFYKPVSPAEEEFFNILIQMGTLLAVVWYFRKELWHTLSLMMGWRKAAATSGGYSLESSLVGGVNGPQLLFYLGVSTAVTMVFVLLALKGSEIGFQAFNLASEGVTDISEFFFRHPELVAVHLFFTGCLLYATEFMAERRNQNVKGRRGGLGMWNAVVVGFSQVISAIFHGVSRSGSTISAGLASGLDRLTATRYSFLLSIPTITAATGYDALKFMKSGHLGAFDWSAMLLGTVISAVVGYFCVKYFILFVARNSLKAFAVYCWMMGLGMFLFFKLTLS